MAIPVYVPFAFIALLVGGLGLFSKIHRSRQAARNYVPWFPTHPERDTYISLLHRTDPKPSDSLLKAALLRRAVTDVRRILRVRDDKAALSALLQKGSIDEELWINFQQAEKELEAEIVEVVTEANTFVDGWGQIIFQSAGEIVQNEKHRDIFAKIAQNKKDLELKLGKSTPGPGAVSEPTSATPAPSITLTPAQPQPSDNENLVPTVNGKLSTPLASPAKGSIPLPSLTPKQQQPANTPSASAGKSASKKKNKKR